MKVNFGKELKTLDGKSISFADRKVTKLKDICLDALLATFEDERNLAGEEKARRYVLATQIYSNSDTDLTIEDVALIKRLIGKGFAPIIVGQAFEILENREKE
jgi:hypothetical protein